MGIGMGTGTSIRGRDIRDKGRDKVRDGIGLGLGFRE